MQARALRYNRRMDSGILKHRFIVRPLIFQVFGLLKRPFQVSMVALFAIQLALWAGAVWILLLKRNIVELVDLLRLPHSISGDKHMMYRLAAPALVFVHLGLSVLELAARRPLFQTFRQKMKWASGVSVFTVVTLFILVHLHPETPANLRTDTSWQLMFGGLLIVMTIGASAWAFSWGAFFDRVRDGIVERMKPRQADDSLVKVPDLSME